MTVFLYTFTERETLYNFFEHLTGARFTTCYARVGGVARDADDGWLKDVRAFCDGFHEKVDVWETHAHPKPDLDGPERGRGRDPEGAGARLRPDRPRPPRLRRRLRRPQGPPVLRLRELRLRRPGRRARRLLRPLPGPPRGDAAVGADRRAGDRRDARRAHPRGRAQVRPAREDARSSRAWSS